MTREDPSPYVVGIGTSAQGLDALRSFFSKVSDESGMAFVVVQHLAPDHASNLVALLERVAPIPVESADEGTEIESDHVYVISPGDLLSFREGTLQTEEIPNLDAERHTIDFFFRSLAEELEERAIGVLLSGAGSDGTAGLGQIKRHGGMTLVQDPDDAGVAMMPQNAIDAGVVDIVAAADELPDHLREITTAGRAYGPLSTPDGLSNERGDELDAIMEMLRARTGNDLSDYKRPTVLRRIGRRMQVHQFEHLHDYLTHLESHADEVDALFDELLIKVTSFFRDPEVWETIRDVVVPSIFEGKSRDDEVRAWVPGCATGEEAYTVAMLLYRHAEELDQSPAIKVFGTDIDHDAIRTARSAVYSTTVASDVPPEYLRRYFRIEDGEYQIAKDVRNRVLFAPQNALTDPPFSNLDLVSCRNLLIYLQPEAQTRLLQLLHYGLRDGGYLVLGASETPSNTPELFTDFDGDHHVYRASPEVNDPDVVPGTAFGFEFTLPSDDEREMEAEPETRADIETLHREALLDSHDLASLLVDEDHKLLHTFGDTESYLTVPIGEPTDDLLPMVAERFRPAVRTMLFEAFRNDAAQRRQLAADDDTDRPAIEIRTHPLDSDDFGQPVVEISFQAVSSAPRSANIDTSDELEDASLIEQYERELEQTRSRLEKTIRDYEAANEKLRASNEELMSMNEELQSTTEELETSKEELQSMNEELQTVNSELNEKIRELDSVNSDLRNLMRSTQIGTLFLNRALEVERFTEPITELFNIRASDRGRPLEHLTHILQTDDFTDDARRVLDEVTTIEREVRDERDRWFLVRMLPYLTVEDRIDGVVIAFVDITERREIQNRLAENEKKFRAVFESAADPMFIYPLDDEGRPESFMESNTAAVETLQTSREELSRTTLGAIVDEESFDLDAHLSTIRREGADRREAELLVEGDEESIPVELHARRMELDGETAVVEVVRDISDQKRYEQVLVEAKERAEELADLRSTFLSTLSHDVRSPLSAILTTAGVLRRVTDSEEADEMIDHIETSCRQLRRILDSILRMAKLESKETVAQPESFDLVDTIGEVLDLYAPLADSEGLDLDYEGPDSEAVALDSRFLTQILNNLVDNAIKYTEDGGVTIRLSESDDPIVLEVADTGIGIPEEERELIFERFESGAEAQSSDYDSTGLGLAIARLLVESMEGTMSVESTLGEGSTFRIELPRDLSAAS